MIHTLFILGCASFTWAHSAAWAPGMYCRGGNNPAIDDANTNLAVLPLYNLTKSQWMFQADRGCNLAPPPAGEFLELPAGKSFTVEIAHNRGQTSLSFGGQYASDWPDGGQHPEDWHGIPTAAAPEGCLDDGAMHAKNQSDTTGTAFAISYQSDLSKVTLDNLVVFTVLEHTPWKRIATYNVPAGLPACPVGGCTCAWLWVPHLCGISNMYMQGFKCNVTGATSNIPLAKAQAPVMCRDDASKCVVGAKQMIAWNQLDGNNIVVDFPNSPGYNTGCGWKSGAQNDIFQSPPVPSSVTSSSAIPTTMQTSTKVTTTSIKTTTIGAATSTTSVAAATPTGPASGTMYLTTGLNWDGYTENWVWARGDCKTLTAAFKANVGSAGPNAGTCTFYSDAICTSSPLLVMTFPGQSNIPASIGKKVKAFKCV